MYRLFTKSLIAFACLSTFTACVKSHSKTSNVKGTDEVESEAKLSPVAPKSTARCNTQERLATDPADSVYAPGCNELLTQFPEVEAKPEDKRVLCPLLRIANKSNELSAKIAAKLAAGVQAVLPVTIAELTSITEKFGCSVSACGPVATAVSAGQNSKPMATVVPTDIVDIGQLHKAKGVAHDCGFSFAYNEIEVTPETRAATLAILKARAVDGQLSFGDLMQTKKDMCKRDFVLSRNGTLPTKNPISASGDTLEPIFADLTEVNLIFTYLGGVDNGSISYDDIERLFTGNMPQNKSKYMIGKPLFDHLKEMLAASARP